MAFGIKEFSNLYPADTNIEGDTINLLISQSYNNTQEQWYAVGATIPLNGINGNLSKIIENAASLKFKYRDIDKDYFIVPAPFGGLQMAGGTYTNPSQSCTDFNGLTSSFAFENAVHYLSPKMYLWFGSAETFNGQNKWYRSPYDYDKIFLVDTLGNINQWYDCTALDTYFSEGISQNYYTGIIKDKKRRTDHFYISFEQPVRLPLSVNGLPLTSSILDEVFFEPQVEERIYTSDYNALINNNEDNRSSKIYLVVDREKDQFTPINYEIISQSLTEKDSRYTLQEDFFANIQDSNYESISWARSRYVGSNYSSKEGEFPAAFSFTPFEGQVYSIVATTSSIVAEETKGYLPKTFYIGTLQETSYTGGNPYVSLIISSSGINETTISGSFYIGNTLTNTSTDITVPIELREFNSLTGNTTTRIENLLINSGTSGNGISFTDKLYDYDAYDNPYYLDTSFNRLVTTSSGSIRFIFANAISNDLQTVLQGSTYIFEESVEKKNDFKVIPQQVIFDKRTRDLYRTDSKGLVINITRNLPI